MPLADIETFVIVMMENRSFDHAVGYLSLANPRGTLPVDGLRDDPAWRARWVNAAAGQSYPLRALAPALQLIDDPPHEAVTIHRQITSPTGGGEAAMGGFVASYLTADPPPADPGLVMGYYGPDAVPVFDFFARKFTVCDQWFASLPLGTQANRLMAMSGESGIVDNASVLLPNQPLVYDWLTQKKVRWCAYQAGDFFPFFALMEDWLPEIVTSLSGDVFGVRGRFRRFARFREHWLAADPMPQVIFIEPEYTDGPHGAPNDDHPPTGIGAGQALLADIYDALIANPGRWANTALIVTYDEHGGFFDHVTPLPIAGSAGGQAFATTGVRVPAFVVSPRVAPGVPFHGKLDHTSILRLIAERFDGGSPYSPGVARRQQRLDPLADVFVPPVPAPQPPVPLPAECRAVSATLPPSEPELAARRAPGASANAQAFQKVAAKVAQDHPDMIQGNNWPALTHYLASRPGR